LRIRGNFHQVHVGFFSHTQGFTGSNNTDLGAIDACQSDLRDSDLMIDPMLTILCYDSTPKKVNILAVRF